MKYLTWILSIAIITSSSAALIKRIDTLSRDQDLNFSKGTKTSNPYAPGESTIYTCTDTVPDIDLFFSVYAALAKTRTTPLCRFAGAYWGIGSPRRFYMPGNAYLPGSFQEPEDPPPSVDSLHFTGPITLVDSIFPVGGTFDKIHIWGAVDTINNGQYGCTLPCFIYFSYDNYNRKYHNVFIVRTKSNKFVLIRLSPIIDTIPSEDPPGGVCYWLTSLIVTSYQQTDGSTDFTGISEINNIDKPIMHLHLRITKPESGFYDIQGRTVRDRGIQNSSNRILFNRNERRIDVSR